MKKSRSTFASVRDALPIENLIFLDESGCHPGIGPRRGWAPLGAPLYGPEQAYAQGQHLSIVGAISIDGLIASSTVRGGVGSKEFRKFIHEKLVPHLQPGHIVCMDNLNAHKNKGALALIESTGATPLFLPPYSPDFNPIEAAWAKVKHFLRKYAPQSLAALRQAIYRSINRVTAEDALGWFRYCGYNP